MRGHPGVQIKNKHPPSHLTPCRTVRNVKRTVQHSIVIFPTMEDVARGDVHVTSVWSLLCIESLALLSLTGRPPTQLDWTNSSWEIYYRRVLCGNIACNVRH